MELDRLQQLVTQLQNGNPRQRRVASYKLGKSKDPSAVPALISSYNDTDSSVRQNVMDGLRSIASSDALDFLAARQKEQETLAVEQPVQTTVPTASSNRRFFNLVIDTILYEIVMFVFIGPLTRLVFGKPFSGNFWASYVLGLFTLFLYYFIFETIFQKTPAKFITGTKVVMEDGSKADAVTIAKRTLCRFVPYDVISMYTGKLPDKKGTWWHDRWTATRVVKN